MNAPPASWAWLNDILPEKAPEYRVLSLEYTLPESQFLWDHLREEAGRIVEQIWAQGEAVFDADSAPRSIEQLIIGKLLVRRMVFVCHGFGGLILKWVRHLRIIVALISLLTSSL